MTAVDRFDRWADDALERMRGHPVPDAVFTAATHLGDFSLIWHIANVTRGLTSDRRARQVPALALALGAESLVVNQGLKRLFGRTRPDRRRRSSIPRAQANDVVVPVRSRQRRRLHGRGADGWDGRRSAPLWWTLASVVAASRAYVRIHHASDVVAGMAVGAALVACRPILRPWESAVAPSLQP